MTKRDKASVYYEPKAEHRAHRCGLCRHFMPMYDKCRLVNGDISPNGWCELFEAKKDKR